MFMDYVNKICSYCGNENVNPYWNFKTTGYCSFRCYATSSAKLLLFLSLFFGSLFVGSMIGLGFTSIPPTIHIPFIVAMLFGPIPGFFISLIGFNYRREDRKNPPVRIAREEKKEIKLESDNVCTICKEEIHDKQKQAMIKPCKHIFHREHIASWMADNDNCPKCNQRIEEITLK